MTARAALDAAVSEAEFQDAVVELARLRGWRIAHFRPAQTSKGWRTAMTGDVGFPDIVLARPPRLLFLELKSERGKLSDGQEAWLSDLAACGVEARLFRPSDWPQVERVLA